MKPLLNVMLKSTIYQIWTTVDMNNTNQVHNVGHIYWEKILTFLSNLQ